MSVHQVASDLEVPVGKTDQLVSTTDLKGVITYCNETFCRIAGFTESELLGQNHNIVRHPDMPKAAFADMWSHLKKVIHGAESLRIVLKPTVITGLMPTSPLSTKMES